MPLKGDMENTKQKIIKLVAIYARVSTGKQEEEETVKSQLMVLRDLAAKNGWTIVKEYVDEGWSGDMLARPMLDELRQDAKKKLWDAVLAYDPDRIARRYSYQELVMDELRDLGIETIFSTIAAPKNSEEKILYGVRGLFAEYERVKIAERFRMGKMRKAREKHIVTSGPPYGYDYIAKKDDVHGYYVINKKEAKIVKMIFNWVLEEKLTIRAIVRRLQEMGIKPRKSHRGVWNTSTLSTMLRRTTYTGEGHYARTYAILPENPLKQTLYKRIKKTSRKIRPREEWVTIPTPAIIEKDLFFRVGQILDENYAMCIRNKKNKYLLAGKIYCKCGKRRVGEGPQHGKHLYYRCSDRVYSYPLKAKCHEAGVNARIADGLVWNRLVKFMSSPETIRKEAQKWLSQKKEKPIVNYIPIEDLEREIAKLKKEEDRYVKAYGGELISMEQLQEYTREIKDKISNLNGQIMYFQQQKKQAQETVLPSEKELQGFCQRVKNMLNYLNFDIKQKIIREAVEKITATKESLFVEGYLEINQEYYVSLRAISRDCWVAECGQINIV